MVALEPARLELVGAKRDRDAAVGEHRARPVRLGEGDDDAVPLGRDRPGQLDPVLAEETCREPSGRVVGALAEPAGRAAERRDPRRDVGALPARGERDP